MQIGYYVFLAGDGQRCGFERAQGALALGQIALFISANISELFKSGLHRGLFGGSLGIRIDCSSVVLLGGVQGVDRLLNGSFVLPDVSRIDGRRKLPYSISGPLRADLGKFRFQAGFSAPELFLRLGDGLELLGVALPDCSQLMDLPVPCRLFFGRTQSIQFRRFCSLGGARRIQLRLRFGAGRAHSLEPDDRILGKIREPWQVVHLTLHLEHRVPCGTHPIEDLQPGCALSGSP